MGKEGERERKCDSSQSHVLKWVLKLMLFLIKKNL